MNLLEDACLQLREDGLDIALFFGGTVGQRPLQALLALFGARL